MAEISAAATDAFILVYSAVEPDSFQVFSLFGGILYSAHGAQIAPPPYFQFLVFSC